VAPTYQGVHESTNCREIKGWARNNKRPNGIAWVKVWIDNLTSNNAAAENYRPDVGAHGFSTTPPGVFKTGNYRTITAKFPNGTILPGSPQTLICQVGIFKNQTPASFIDTGGRWQLGNGIFPGTTSCSNFWTDVYFDQ